MRGLVATAAGEFAVIELADPTPCSGEVIVEVAACGACGTDRHLLSGDHPHVRFPLVPGHEFYGRIVQIGSRLSGAHQGSLHIDDWVAVNPSRYCDRCRPCLRGRPNLCDSKGGYGIAHNGGFAPYAAVRADYVHVLSGEVDDRYVLAEPLACVLHASDVAGRVAGDNVLIFGAGPIGLLLAMVLADRGAANVSIVDVDDARVRLARQVVDGPVVADSVAVDRRQWDLVVDATGNVRALEQALPMVAKGGALLIVGVPGANARLSVPVAELLVAERRILTSFSLAHSFERALATLAADRYPVEKLLTERMPLALFESSLRQVENWKQLKTVVAPADG